VLHHYKILSYQSYKSGDAIAFGCTLIPIIQALHYHLSFLPPAKLIKLIEILVSHSISSVEMKSFLRLLGPNCDGHLPTYSHKLQELLLKMALKDTRIFPLHYIDLTALNSVSDILFVCIPLTYCNRMFFFLKHFYEICSKMLESRDQ